MISTLKISNIKTNRNNFYNFKRIIFNCVMFDFNQLIVDLWNSNCTY